MTTTFEQLQVLLQPGISPTVADADLMEQFVKHNESTAFCEIVRRHGPMVLGVCRRILHHHHDAEDAFQAVFLVLAQKAETVSPRHQLPAWLYGVATRTAMKARSILHQQRLREASLSDDPVSSSEPDHDRTELTSLLDEELQRLPEKYRLPILLCELQGKTRHAVAEQLGWPEGTVAGRLHRAKQMLARRLSKRGIAVGAGTLTTTLSASASVPMSLIASTIRLATISRFGNAGTTLVPGTIQTLAEGVGKTMAIANWKVITACLCLFTVTAGAGYFGTALAGGGESDPTSGKRSGSSGHADLEPMDPTLALQESVQKELRLSQNQIQKLKAAWDAGKKTTREEERKQEQIDQEIKELRKKLELLHRQKQQYQAKVRSSQSESLKQAIHANLSRQAQERLQQLTLRQTNLRQLLMDQKMQARLNINDEQIKKLQELNQDVWYALELMTFTQDRVYPVLPMPADRDRLKVHWDHGQEKEIMKILTPEQKAKWKKMLGEPWPRPKK